MTGRDEFGPSLRRERECRGITLEQVAAKTKIAASLFAAMERNDFSRWPHGIFRRSFLRAYAEVVGLDADELVRRFLQLFPSPDDSAAHAEKHSAVVVPIRQPDGARMRLADEWTTDAAQSPVSPLPALRVAATLADVGIVALLASAGWLLGGWLGLRTAALLSGTLLFVVSSIILGRTPGAWLLGRASDHPSASLSPAAPGPHVANDDRPAAKRRTIGEPHQPPRRQNVRRLDRSRSRRA
jgi:transcriptional regulator with XRE-family HTH domain